MTADENKADYQRTPVRTDARLMIQSCCVKCGESKLVSHYDSSLEVWETQHQCKSKAKSTDGRAN